jgi:glyoxylase-like metal-dependent hydrolase (beta-lactamase superfamily II)
MRLTDHIYLVGGGSLGFGLSHDLDCHVYLVDGGREMALIDGGAGVTIEPILERIRFDGLDPSRLRYLVLTHAHADHAGAAALWREKLGVEVVASAVAAEYVRNGDEERISLAIAKRGGFYPADFVFRACGVARVLSEGDSLTVGDLELRAFETPGHCSGMLSLLVKDDRRHCLFSGDTVFHGGKLLMSNLWDCNLQDYVASIRKLAALEVDALLPGHLAIALSGGGRHIHKAQETLDCLTLPPNII